jgi:ABC-type nickel/cobalt efflux system permease component RcnA
MTESLVGSSYVAILMIGLIHGLEPGHGWPVAALLSTATKRRYAYGLAASLILSAAHFVSSLAVVAIYFVMTTFFGTAIDFGAPWFKIATAAALLILAYRFYREKEHPYSHMKRTQIVTLTRLAKKTSTGTIRKVLMMDGDSPVSVANQ